MSNPEDHQNSDINPAPALAQRQEETKAELSAAADSTAQPELAEKVAAFRLSSSPEQPMNEEPAASEATPATEMPAAKEGGIEILVQMAEKNEIDPKNIDIIDVTDRFLKAIAAAPKENLRQSGKILFHASVLLRMKAEALLAISNDDDSFALDDFMEFDENGSPIIYDSHTEPVARQITLQDLERALVRRAHSKQFRQRKVTLEQLIEALREAEKIETQRSHKRHTPKIDLEGQHEINDVEDILDLAHDEDIELVIQRIEEILLKLVDNNDLVSLLELIKLLGRGGDWVDAFLGVLFLSNAGKISLQQDEFYGPLYIVRVDQPPAVPPTPIAV